MNSLYKEKVHGIYNDKDSIKVLVLGNSHANYGVDPKEFSLYAYNLANVNQSLYFDKRLTLKFLPQLPNLKYVLINVDYHSLYFSSQGIRDVWSYYGNGIKYKNKRYFLYDISPFLFGYTPNASMSMIKRSFKNKKTYKNTRIIDFDVENGVNIKDSIIRGFITYEKHDDSFFNKERYEQRADYFNNIVYNSREKKEVLIDLKDFIRELKSKGVTPIVFSCPVYQEYRLLLNDSIMEENHKDISQICEEFHIKHLDFDKENNGFSKIDFYNCDHLNKEGSKKFSQMLNDSINHLRLINSHTP